MLSCKIIHNPQVFKLSSNWQEVNPSQKGNFVDAKGQVITPAYAGSRYKVLCEAQHTKIVRIRRLVQGILALILTLGTAYFCSNKVKSLFARKHKLYICPTAAVQDELKKDDKLQNSIPRINEIGGQNLVPERKEFPKQDRIGLVDAKPIIVEPKISLEKAQQALEEGIDISPKTMERIKVLMPKIANRNSRDFNHEDIDLKIINIGQFFSVFSIPEEPDLVFKIARHNHFHGKDKPPTGGKEETVQRFKNTVIGKQAILQHDLDLLHIPPTKIFTVESDGYEYAIIAEKRLTFKEGHYAQQDQYYKNADALKPLAKQLARFIFETADDDVRFSNYPILDQDETAKGQPVQCGVIDLEWVGNSSLEGFTGGYNHNSIGLIGMMPNEELVDTVIEEGKKLGLKFEGFQDAAKIKAKQLSNIETYHKYQKFYDEKGIKTGQEPFMSIADIDQLGLDLDEKWDHSDETFSLRQAVIDVINAINKKIINQKESSHVKAMRDVEIPHKREFLIYQNLGLPPEKTDLSWEEEKQLWLNRILDTLLKKGHIFSYEKTGHGYFIKC